MGGFLMVGILVAFLAGLGAIFFAIPALSLTVSAAFVLLMSGLILYETSNIIHGGETIRVMAYRDLVRFAIFNLFTSLLQLLGFITAATDARPSGRETGPAGSPRGPCFLTARPRNSSLTGP